MFIALAAAAGPCSEDRIGADCVAISVLLCLQGYPQAQQQPYGAQPGYSSSFMQQQPSVGAAFPGAPVARAAPPRPTVVIPGGHMYGGVVPSPAASMHSPGSFGSSQGFSPQGGLSPAGEPSVSRRISALAPFVWKCQVCLHLQQILHLLGW